MIGIDRIKTHFIGWTSFPCDPNRFSSLNDPLSAAAAGLGGKMLLCGTAICRQMPATSQRERLMDDEGRPIDRSIDSSANNTLLINSEGVIAFYDQSDTLLLHKINSEAEYQRLFTYKGTNQPLQRVLRNGTEKYGT